MMRVPALMLVWGAFAGLASAAEPFDFSTASSRRVDVVMIGDSNQVLGGHGWDEGYAAVLAERYGEFATGVFSVGENKQSGAGAGYKANAVATTGMRNARTEGAPERLCRWLSAEGEYHFANYLEVYKSRLTVLPGPGMDIQRGSVLDHDSRLRFWYSYGTYPSGNGSFVPSIRSNEDPFGVYLRGDRISTRGEWGVHLGTLDLEASTPGGRSGALGFFFFNNAEPLVAPALFYYVRAEDLDRPTGTSVSTLYYGGGRSARDMAHTLQIMKDDTIGLFFEHILRANRRGSIVVRMNSGLNDREETEPSVGPARVAQGNSAAAYADNMVAMIRRIQEYAEKNHLDASQLHFVISTSHPISTPNDPKLTSYEQAALGVPAMVPGASVRVVILSSLITADEMSAAGYYNTPEDHAHLTRAGYVELSRREIDALTN